MVYIFPDAVNMSELIVDWWGNISRAITAWLIIRGSDYKINCFCLMLNIQTTSVFLDFPFIFCDKT